jgi:hypothetical protein
MTNQATNEQTCSLTDALALHGIALTAAAANKVLHGAGMIERRWRDSSKPGRRPKSYWAATSLGERHGVVNEVSDRGGDPVIVRYASSRFRELWASNEVQETLSAMLSEGEVHMREAASQEAL